MYSKNGINVEELSPQEWKDVRMHFSRSFRSNLHVSIASVNADNIPKVTPIGTFFINDDHTGFYFEKFTAALPSAARNENKNVCILGVDSNRWFWLKSLFHGRFERSPAIKLYGKLGQMRNAQPHELNRLKRRLRKTRMLKGHKLLWDEMNQVRDIRLTHIEPIRLPGLITSKTTNEDL